MSHWPENINSDLVAEVRIRDAPKCCVCSHSDPLFLFTCLGCRKIYCCGRHNDWRDLHDSACTNKTYQSVATAWSERLSEEQLLEKMAIFIQPGNFDKEAIMRYIEKFSPSSKHPRSEVVNYLQGFLTFSSQKMNVEEAKVFWRNNPERVQKVIINPCNFNGWKPRTQKCSISERKEIVSRLELDKIPNSCSLKASFRSDTLCPKTRCDNGGTRGGWCANIMPDGTYHCLHCWCHHGPCTTSIHQCEVVSIRKRNQ